MDESSAALAVNKLSLRLTTRAVLTRETDDYYKGKHRLRFATDKWAKAHSDRYAGFADNWCAPVADSTAERLQVDGFKLDDGQEMSGEEKQLWRDWTRNNLDTQSMQGFHHSVTSSRSFALVWGDDDHEPNVTWERSDEVIVDYDPERPSVATMALKLWRDDDDEYATLYTPEYLWRFQRPVSAGFDARGERAPVGTNPGGWVKREDPQVNPMGRVPIVEFPNRPMLGRSPLSAITGTMAMQDAINLLWAYLFNAADFASMPTRVILGQEPPRIPVLGDDGQVVGFEAMSAEQLAKLSQDRMMWLNGENTKIGQWDAAKLDVFTATIETAVTHIAAQTRTPPHYLILGKGMVNVNADGMKAAEIGLVQKVKNTWLSFTPGIRELFRLMALVRGNESVAEQCTYGTVQWRDAENRSEAQLVDALVKLRQIGFPFAFIAERYGLSQTDLARVLEMRDLEAATDPVALALSTPVTAPVTEGADDDDGA